MKTLHDLFIGEYKISQTFGVNYDVYKWIKDYKGNPIKGHNGIDWATPNGTVMLNPFPKNNNVVVSFVGFDKSGYGNYMRIWDKTQRCVVLYAHLQEVIVKQGDKLYFQQEVAKTDNTGWSTGPHLHFAFYEVDDAGNKLNRDNGFDGFLHPLSGVVEWKILNPTAPAKPPSSDPCAELKRKNEELKQENVRLSEALKKKEAEYKALQTETEYKIAEVKTECQQKIQTLKGEHRQELSQTRKATLNEIITYLQNLAA